MILEQWKGVHWVDLGASFPKHIFLRNLASIQPLTSPFKFARSPRTYLPGSNRKHDDDVFVDAGTSRQDQRSDISFLDKTSLNFEMWFVFLESVIRTKRMIDSAIRILDRSFYVTPLFLQLTLRCALSFCSYDVFELLIFNECFNDCVIDRQNSDISTSKSNLSEWK